MQTFGPYFLQDFLNVDVFVLYPPLKPQITTKNFIQAVRVVGKIVKNPGSGSELNQYKISAIPFIVL